MGDAAPTKTGIRVSIRIKPLDNPSEDLVVKPNENNVDNSIDVETNFSDISSFTYGHIHWSTGNDKIDPSYATQEDLFNDVGKPIVDSALQGFNCCVFAYGQTGSGKTYTMMGGARDDQAQEGLIPRICRAMLLGESSTDGRDPLVLKTEFEVSYVELYLEKVKDLLGPVNSSSNLKVRENPTSGPFVEGCSTHEVTSYPQLLELLEHGNSNRQVAATKMNEVSSRSHVIFTLKVTQTKANPEADGGGIALQGGGGGSGGGGFNSHLSSSKNNVVTCKVNLVDLAGSESVKQAATSGERLKEGASINKSLLTLGRVIKSLSTQAQTHGAARKSRRNSLMSPQEEKEKEKEKEKGGGSTRRRSSMGGSGSAHAHLSSSDTDDEPAPSPHHRATAVVPYRESVLTFLLKESLGGNSSSSLIATIRPGRAYLEETLSTLRFAAQAGRVENKPVVNETNPYLKTISALRKQIEDLSRELSAARGAGTPIANGLPPAGPSSGSQPPSLAASPATTSSTMMDPSVVAAVAAAQASVAALEALSLAHEEAEAEKAASGVDNESRGSEHSYGGDNAAPVRVAAEEEEVDVVYALPEEGESLRLSQESPDKIQVQRKLSEVSEASELSNATLEVGGGQPKEERNRSSDCVLVDKAELPQPAASGGSAGFSTPPTVFVGAAPQSASPTQGGGGAANTWAPVPSPAGAMPPHVIKYTPSPTAGRSRGNSPSPGDAKCKSTSPPPDSGKPQQAVVNPMTQPAAVIGGYLLKRGFLNTAYKQRWCILLHNRIIFYVGYYGQVRGSINLYQCTIDQHPAAELQYENGANSFELTTPHDVKHKHWMLQALTAPEKVNWILAIQEASQLSDEATQNRTTSISNLSSFVGGNAAAAGTAAVAPPGYGSPAHAHTDEHRTWWGFVSGTK